MAATEVPHPTEGPDTGTTTRLAAAAAGAARRRRAPSLEATVAAAVAGFLVVFELLAYQLRSGHDPAIGAGSVTAQVQSGSAAGNGASGSSNAVVTRASGGTTAGSRPTQATAAVARPAPPAPHSIATHTSGGQKVSSPVAGDDATELEGRL